MSGYYVGGETDYYTPAEPLSCPCSEAGLTSCYCGGPIGLAAARDWLTDVADVDGECLDAVDVVVAIEEHHPDGFQGWFDEAYGEWASRRLRVEA